MGIPITHFTAAMHKLLDESDEDLAHTARGDKDIFPKLFAAVNAVMHYRFAMADLRRTEEFEDANMEAGQPLDVPADQVSDELLNLIGVAP